MALDLPFTPLTVGDNAYKLCFDLNAIFDAEEKMVAAGHDVNFLALKWKALNGSGLRALFVASLQRCHPEISKDQARGIFVAAGWETVLDVVGKAYRDFQPVPEPAKVSDEGEAQPGN